MKKVNKRHIYFGIFWVILVTTFLFCAIVLIVIVNGYHFNRNNFRLEKTGMIVVNGNTEPVDVTLNGVPKTVNLPAKFSLLFPGSYNVSIKKQGYYGFQKSFQLSGSQAVVINDINLILQDLKASEISADDKTRNKILSDNSSEIIQFNVKNNEIWRNNELITRFSQTVIAAVFDTSSNQFFIQLEDGIHMIMADGSNDNLVLKLESSSPVTMSLNGNTLSYIQSDKVYQVKLR